MRIYATDNYYNEQINLTKDNNRIKGFEGEKKVFQKLKTLASEKYQGFIIPNFEFFYDEKVECDFLVVCKNAIIIIEVKNWRTG